MNAYAFVLVVLVVLVLVGVIAALARALDTERGRYADLSRRIVNALVSEEPADYVAANKVDQAGAAEFLDLERAQRERAESRAVGRRERPSAVERPPGSVIGME